ncbi:hypothetical protein D3C72_1651650 [compost metagenome]
MPLASPANARLCTVEVPMSRIEIARNSSPKPSICLSSKQATASGVLSRPVNPVPPVISTTWMPSSAIQFATCARILYRSSLSRLRSLRVWPASSKRLTSNWPEVSLAYSRVSLTVSTAIFRGINNASGLTLMGFSGRY